MRKPRLLIPVSIHFSVRYVLRTGLLRLLSDLVQPVILLGWQDEELRRELEQAGAEVQQLPDVAWGPEYERIRTLTNLWYMRRLASPTVEIYQRRMLLQRTLYNRTRRRLRNLILQTGLALPGADRRVLQSEVRLFHSDTNAAAVARWAAGLRADAVFSITPYLPREEMIARCCVEAGIPACTAILSFDNVTTRGWIPVTFGQYFVWNRHNAAELVRSYPLRPEDVRVVGPPQFDFYWDSSYLWDERQWRRRLRLPPGRPVIFFGGGHYGCAPHEPRFLKHIDDAISARRIPGRPIILFRSHPVDPIERWQPILREMRHVVCDYTGASGPAAGKHDLRRHDIEKLASSLFHSAVHVNVASTMTVDGAIFDKPQIGPAYDDQPGQKYDRTAKELYLQEHFLPITHSGGLTVAGSRTDLEAAIRSGLEEPLRLSPGRRQIVTEICTYPDGRSTERVARAVASFLAGGQPALP